MCFYTMVSMYKVSHFFMAVTNQQYNVTSFLNFTEKSYLLIAVLFINMQF